MYIESIELIWFTSERKKSILIRLGDFLHYGQQFKAGGNNYFTQIAHIVGQFL